MLFSSSVGERAPKLPSRPARSDPAVGARPCRQRRIPPAHASVRRSSQRPVTSEHGAPSRGDDSEHRDQADNSEGRPRLSAFRGSPPAAERRTYARSGADLASAIARRGHPVRGRVRHGDERPRPRVNRANVGPVDARAASDAALPGHETPGLGRLDRDSALFLKRGVVEGEWSLEARTWGDPPARSVHEWHVLAAVAAHQLTPRCRPNACKPIRSRSRTVRSAGPRTSVLRGFDAASWALNSG